MTIDIPVAHRSAIMAALARVQLDDQSALNALSTYCDATDGTLSPSVKLKLVEHGVIASADLPITDEIRAIVRECVVGNGLDKRIVAARPQL